MLMLHTADWHLGESLLRLDRTADLRARVQDVTAICEARKVDLVVIAGDLFASHSGMDAGKLTQELQHVYDAFAGFFDRGGTILAVTGNHDRDRHTEFIRTSMKLAAVPTRGTLNTGRMYLQNGPGLTRFERNGEIVQFVLVPYPLFSRYAESDDPPMNREEQNRVVRQRVARWLKLATDKEDFDPSLPSVLVAHVHVSGAEVHRLYDLNERDDVCFDGGAIPSHWAYAALGHIHKPQALGNVSHIRYCGPLDRLRIDERDDPRGVILVEIGAKGRVGEPEWIPLAATPMYDVLLEGPGDLAALTTKYPKHREAIVRVLVRHDSTAAERIEITREVKRIFPRYSELRWETAPVASVERSAVRSQADYRETVRKYLLDELEGDADGPAIAAIVEACLAEVA